ncbi:MAG: hypothetical protein ACXWM6_05690, partial [Thermodesulfobacteriota bacterium]
MSRPDRRGLSPPNGSNESISSFFTRVKIKMGRLEIREIQGGKHHARMEYSGNSILGAREGCIAIVNPAW